MRIAISGTLVALPLALAGCVDDSAGHRTNMPTYQQQTGYDPATANMTMCSDGALREDCSFAPNGY